MPFLKNLISLLTLILSLSACTAKRSDQWSGNWTVYEIVGVPVDSINNGKKYFSRGINMNIDERDDFLLLTMYSGDYVTADFKFNSIDSTITISNSKLNWLNNEFDIYLDSQGSRGHQLDHLILYTDSIDIYARREIVRLKY